MQKKSSRPLPTALSSDAHVLLIHNFLLRSYGAEWLEWLPETLWATLAHDFEFEPSRLWKDKAQALRITLATNRPWVEFEAFENTGTAFNGEVPNMTLLEPLSPGEAIVTRRILDTLRNDKYALEVLSYVAACFFHDGLVTCLMPDVQPLLDKLYEEQGYYDPRLRDDVQRIFPLVWSKKDELTTIREHDPVDCQVRKLFQAHKYAEENDGKWISGA